MTIEDKKGSSQEEFEAYAKKLLVRLYVSGEVGQSDLANSSTIPTQISHPGIREILNRMRFDSQMRASLLADQASAIFEDRVLGQIENPDKRMEIQSRALSEAIGYWQQRVTEPDLTPNEILLARRRLTKLTSKLESLGQGE